MNPRTLRRVLVTLVAALGLAGLALFGSSAASAEDAAAGTATADEAPAAAESSSTSESKASSSSDATSTEGSESSADHNDSTPTAADANVSGPAEWEMDGEAALDDPNLLPGDPVPEADPGTGVTPQYKVDETDADSPNRLRLEIDDDPKVVAPGEWLDWWITVTNIGENPATGIQVTDYVPDNVYYNTFSIDYWDSNQVGMDAADWDCGYQNRDGRWKQCYQVGDPLDPGSWVTFLANGQVKWSADPGDVVTNVVEVDWNENPEPWPLSVVEFTPIVSRHVANILPVTGSDSTFSLLFAGLGLLGAGGLGLGFASRKRS